MIGKLLWRAFLEMGKPDPPHVAAAKHVYRETRAAAELSNAILPIVLKEDPVTSPHEPKE